MVRVGLCGFGYWGPNLLRVFQHNAGFQVVAIADSTETSRLKARKANPGARLFASAEDLIADPDLDAVVIATPVDTHYALCRQALTLGKHVLVEKPLCTSVDEGRELVALSQRNALTLMVDHTYLFHGIARRLRVLKEEGALGTISYYDSLRVNLGLFQPDVNVLWDLGSHDFSIMDYILDEEPLHVEASGYCHVNPGVPDIAYITVHFASPIIAHFNLSWMSPVKVRRISIGGSKRMVIWDDLSREEPLKIFDSGITKQPEEQRGLLMPTYRIGDIYSPRVEQPEPLAELVEHFRAVIAGREESIMDGGRGLRVVRMLTAAQDALDHSLKTTADLRSGHDVRQDTA